MSKPVFQDLFSFQGRRNRQSYALYLLTFMGLAMLLGATSEALARRNPDAQMVIEIAALSIGTILIVSLLAVTSQRCRDFNWRGWLAATIALPSIGPVAILVFTFIPGSIAENRFGGDPTG